MPKVSPSYLEARRQQILDAAVECFLREGFHRATMQEIVQQSGLSPGAIYRYFKSKDEIIEAIANERHTREQELILTARSQVERDDAAALFRELMRQFFGMLEDDDERKRRRLGIQVWAEALRDPRIHLIVLSGIDEPRALLAEIITSLQAHGELSPQLAPDALARVMIALFQGFILQQAWDPKVETQPYMEVVEALFGSLLGPTSSTQTAHSDEPK